MTFLPSEKGKYFSDTFDKMSLIEGAKTVKKRLLSSHQIQKQKQASSFSLQQPSVNSVTTAKVM